MAQGTAVDYLVDLKEAHGKMHRAKKLTAATCLMCPVILDYEVVPASTISASQQQEQPRDQPPPRTVIFGEPLPRSRRSVPSRGHPPA